MTHRLREHGLGDLLGEPTGAPVAAPLNLIDAIERETAACPGCGCRQLMEIEVRLKDLKLMTAETGSGRYMGCPACPWAGPMVVAAGRAPWSQPVTDLGTVRNQCSDPPSAEVLLAMALDSRMIAPGQIMALAKEWGDLDYETSQALHMRHGI